MRLVLVSSMCNILLFKFVSLPLEDKTSGSVLEYPISFSKVLGLIVCTGNYYLPVCRVFFFVNNRTIGIMH